MNKITILSIVTATLLFTGCGEDTEQTASEATTQALESTKEAVAEATDATEDAVENAVEAIKEAAEETKDAIEKD